MADDWSFPPEADGFHTDTAEPKVRVRTTPMRVQVPNFFDGCRSNDEVTIKMIGELQKPYSVERDGIDEMYRRISLALIVLLANKASFLP